MAPTLEIRGAEGHDRGVTGDVANRPPGRPALADVENGERARLDPFPKALGTDDRTRPSGPRPGRKPFGAVWGHRLQSFHRAFASAVKRAKLPADVTAHLRQHDLRHRRVTTWLAGGASPALVQKAMGHADLATTMGYAHLLDDDLLALVEDAEDRALKALAIG